MPPATKRRSSPRAPTPPATCWPRSPTPGEPLQHKLDYTYDGRGIRVARAESPANGPNTTARRFSLYTPELQLLAVTRDDASNVWTLSAADKDIHYEIVWFAGRPVAQVSPGGAKLHTFTDHLGTPILQTDATANVVWRAEYEPFGNIYEMREGKRTDQPLRFPGQEEAMNWEGQGENYNIFRWYRSGWGRYTQSDPLDRWPYIARDERSTQTFHPYAYADGSPMVLADPLGLDVSPGGPLKKACWGKCVEVYEKEMLWCKTFKVNDEKNCAVGLSNCIAKSILAPLYASDCKKKYEICKSNLTSRWEQCSHKASVIYQNCLYENKCCQ